MYRKLWGEFTDDSDDQPPEAPIPTSAKKAKLDEVSKKDFTPKPVEVKLKLKNSLVTQTIEVMKQTEMLTSLIDTYATKSDNSQDVFNPCQVMPEVDFPPENSANFVNTDKFAKPFSFIPPEKTDFTMGKPKDYPELTPDICRKALRKSISGLMSMGGFVDTTDSALVLFTDATEEFLKQFIKQIRDIHDNDERLERKTEIDVNTVEKACVNFTKSSLLDLSNYYKHKIVAKNQSEIAAFNNVYEHYNKLMEESRKVPVRTEQYQYDDDMPSTSAAAAAAAAASGSSSGPLINPPLAAINPGEINKQPLNLDVGYLSNDDEAEFEYGQTPIKLENILEHEGNLAAQLHKYSTGSFLSN